jgi:hypothetical protein
VRQASGEWSRDPTAGAWRRPRAARWLPRFWPGAARPSRPPYRGRGRRCCCGRRRWRQRQRTARTRAGSSSGSGDVSGVGWRRAALAGGPPTHAPWPPATPRPLRLGRPPPHRCRRPSPRPVLFLPCPCDSSLLECDRFHLLPTPPKRVNTSTREGKDRLSVGTVKRWRTSQHAAVLYKQWRSMRHRRWNALAAHLLFPPKKDKRKKEMP